MKKGISYKDKTEPVSENIVLLYEWKTHNSEEDEYNISPNSNNTVANF